MCPTPTQLPPTPEPIGAGTPPASTGTAFGAVGGSAVTSLSVDTQGFRFGSITDIRDVNLLPGAVKYGDLPALLALCAPAALTVVGEQPESIALKSHAIAVSWRARAVRHQ